MRKMLCIAGIFLSVSIQAQTEFERLLYKDDVKTTDLGVGLWAQPLPMDYDNDGDLDLVVATADVPYNGIYLFENPGGDDKYPVFKKAKRLGKAEHNITVSYLDSETVVMTPNHLHSNFHENAISKGVRLKYRFDYGAKRSRAKQWKLTDYNGDGLTDLIIGVGVWDDYGWDDAYNEKGEWVNGPLHGYIYVGINTGTNDNPDYAEAFQVMTGDTPLDVYGAPSPNFSDWDGDGDLDIICGEFLDRISYFKNTGSRTEPSYAKGVFLQHKGEVIKMELEMLQVVTVDWDGDLDTDIIVGQEDGRVALMECTGKIKKGVPEFLPPVFFKQEADAVKIGALCTPVSVDWDSDGDEDIISGDTAGFINFVENLDGNVSPSFAEPVRLEADGDIIRIMAGDNGSIQGPAEAKWGYTVLDVADWNHDGVHDIVINSIWGKIVWYQGFKNKAGIKLKAEQPVQVAWDGDAPYPAWNWWKPEGDNLVAPWRTTPLLHDMNNDGLTDLIMLDAEGYLSFYERSKSGDNLFLLPPRHIFVDENGEVLRLNERTAGKSGRRKLALCDWDGDGKIDLLANSVNVDFWENMGEKDGKIIFKNTGTVSEQKLAGHTTSPTTTDWDKDGIPELLVGAEDGFIYYLKR